MRQTGYILLAVAVVGFALTLDSAMAQETEPQKQPQKSLQERFESLLSGLKSEEYAKREQAALGIVELGAAVIPLLQKELARTKDQQVHHTIETLLKKPHVYLPERLLRKIPDLRKKLQSEDAQDRSTAANRLRRVGGKEAAFILTVLVLHSRDDKLRNAAAWPLINLRDPDVGQVMLPSLKSSNTSLQVWAAYAVSYLKDKRAVPGLIPMLSSTDRECRAAAAGALASIADPAAVKAMIQALKDPEDGVRMSAAFYFARVKDKGAIKPLIETLTHEDYEVVDDAAAALGRLRAKEAVSHLIKIIEGELGEIRDEAMIALGLIGDKKAVAPLKKILKKDKNEPAALVALVLLGDADAEKALLKEMAAFSQREEWKRPRHIEPNPFFYMAFGGAGKDIVPFLKKALKHDKPRTRALACNYLARIARKDAIDQILPLLKDNEERVRFAAACRLAGFGRKDGLKELLKALKSSDRYVQRDAAKALQTAGDSSAVPALLPLLKHEMWWVRKEAAEALGNIGDKSAVPALMEMLEGKSPLKDKDHKRWERGYATNALSRITGLDLIYYNWTSDKALQSIIAEYRKWWLQNKSKSPQDK